MVQRNISFFQTILTDVRQAIKAGCHSSTVCISIMLYADDFILHPPTVTGLQMLLTAVEHELIGADMKLNVNKSSINAIWRAI
jgi:hypothetical protein